MTRLGDYTCPRCGAILYRPTATSSPHEVEANRAHTPYRCDEVRAEQNGPDPA